MIDLETSIEIARPVQEVFAFVADQTNAPQWQTGLHEVRRLTDGPIGVGSEHEFVRTFAGRRFASRNRFVAFEPGRYVKFEIPSGWISGTASYRTEASPDAGTVLTSRMEFASDVRCRCWSPSSPDSWPRTHDATSSGSRAFWSHQHMVCDAGSVRARWSGEHSLRRGQ